MYYLLFPLLICTSKFILARFIFRSAIIASFFSLEIFGTKNPIFTLDNSAFLSTAKKKKYFIRETIIFHELINIIFFTFEAFLQSESDCRWFSSQMMSTSNLFKTNFHMWRYIFGKNS